MESVVSLCKKSQVFKIRTLGILLQSCVICCKFIEFISEHISQKWFEIRKLEDSSR